MDDLLHVTDLEVGFTTENGLARVLDHVNFSIGRGEIVGLVGESGCGKTTLARAILGVLPANSARIGSGTIDFEGHRLNFEDALRAIREGREPSINGEEARRSIAVIEALYASAEAGGKRVDV